jgi:hypothetical protein
MGPAPSHGAHRGHAVPAEGVGEETWRCLLGARRRAPAIDGLARLVDRAREGAPWSLHLGVRLIPPPATPDQALAATERRCQCGAVLQAPAVDRRVADGHPTSLPEVFRLAVTHRTGHRPPHARQEKVLPALGALAAHHHRSPARTLTHNGGASPHERANEQFAPDPAAPSRSCEESRSPAFRNGTPPAINTVKA